MFKFLILAVLVPAVMMDRADNVEHEHWDVVQFRTCSGGRPQPHELRVENCPETPCLLRRGSSAMMAMDFSARHASQQLRVNVVATALGITAPYELPADRAAACNWLVNSRCPLTTGEDLTYHLEMPITAIYPLVGVAVEVDVRDLDTAESHGCFILDIRVVAN